MAGHVCISCVPTALQLCTVCIPTSLKEQMDIRNLETVANSSPHMYQYPTTIAIAFSHWKNKYWKISVSAGGGGGPNSVL
jgi:hypothetical protein